MTEFAGNTVFVQRDGNGTVRGVYSYVCEGVAEEELPDDDPEVVAFLNPPMPVPQTLSRRQFFQQAAIDGMISEDEAFAAVATGTIPPPMQDYIDSLPADEQFNAKMLFGGAQVFERNAEITSDFGHEKGMTDEEIDQFFIDGANLTA